MSLGKFKFVSPGVFIDEIDNSQLIREPGRMGPVVIGRTAKGPAMRPYKVNSLSEFVEVFGDPMPGGGGGDAWRDGNKSTPTYASYAAYAWLKNNSPVTMVRLLGAESNNKTTNSGEAGWNMGAIGITATDGGAYGLFVMPSSSNGGQTNPVSGCLAAVWYMTEGVMELSGTLLDTNLEKLGAATVINSNTSNTAQMEFTTVYTNASGVEKKFKFNFNENSSRYIRNVFNTNPTVTNTSITTANNRETYFLGETFDDYVTEVLGTAITGSTSYSGVILGLADHGAVSDWSDQRVPLTRAETGWFFSQDLGENASYNPANMTRLFKFVSLDGGEWTNNNLKVSISDIAASTTKHNPYGSFTVLLRQLNDTDAAVKIVESFPNCNLNPNSPNYIARKIGDSFLTWDDTEKRYSTRGNHGNNSKYIYVEMNSEVDDGVVEPKLLPFGVDGPLNYLGFSFVSGSVGLGGFEDFGPTENDNVFVEGSGSIYMVNNTLFGDSAISGVVDVGQTNFSASLTFPKLKLRTSSDQFALAGPTLTYFGVDTNKTGSSEFDPSVREILRSKPKGLASFTDDYSGALLEVSWRFSLDELSSSAARTVYYVSGSRASSTSYTAISTGSVDGWEAILDLGYNKFTTVFFGGHDGLDITEKDPFRDSVIAGGTEQSSYEYYSVKRAIDMLSDAEVVEYNLACMPGITNAALTSHLMDVCETRGDALAIVDIASGYADTGETTTNRTSATAYGSVSTAVSTLRSRNLNTSYGCTYYPWVQIRDTNADSMVWVPPSVVALGTMGSSEANQALWFAPAGFTRGGLTDGAAGLPVVAVRDQLRSKDRDKLYEQNINPIASFPAEGIVVFGQKTLQMLPSALDRINVRRMLVHVKKEISRIAATTLFEPNVRQTWNAFSGRVKSFLTNVKTGLGVDDFKLVLDETTTTPELVDRNVMYAKILIKPTRAIEYIALDFVVTNNGASFED